MAYICWDRNRETEMNELKMGDVVEIFSNSVWGNERIFIKHGAHDSAICVSVNTETAYNQGRSFITTLWKTGDWRAKKESEYVPFTYDDTVGLLGSYVKMSESELTAIVTSVSETTIGIGQGTFTYDEFFNCFTYFDGSPCGKVKE